jgi:serpin B
MKTATMIGSGILALACVSFWTGCGRNSPGSEIAPVTPSPVAQGVIKSALPRDSVRAPDADIAAVTNGNNLFGWSLLQKLQDQGSNLFFSPYSVTSALAMTWAGAKGQTAAEMKQTLRFPFDSVRLHAAINSIDLALAERGQNAGGHEGAGFALRVSNSLWGEQTFTFLPSYLDLLAQYYDAGMHPVDFVNNPEPARLSINAWVYQQTNGKIKNLIPQGQVNNQTKLVLTNTVYFDAAWADSFAAGSTDTGAFTLASGGTMPSPFMHKKAQFNYNEDADFKAIELPYSGKQVSMVIVLPKTSAGSNATAIPYSRITGLLAGFSSRQVALSLPKFSFTYGTASFNQQLADLGMPTAFTNAADFSGITGTRNLCVGNVLHQAYVAVDENGTTAAAATAVIVIFTATPVDPQLIVFSADHPFLFFIRDIPTEQIVFMGYVAQPTIAQ